MENLSSAILENIKESSKPKVNLNKRTINESITLPKSVLSKLDELYKEIENFDAHWQEIPRGIRELIDNEFTTSITMSISGIYNNIEDIRENPVIETDESIDNLMNESVNGEKYYDVFYREETAPNEYRSVYVDTYDNQDQAYERVSELGAEGCLMPYSDTATEEHIKAFKEKWNK